MTSKWAGLLLQLARIIINTLKGVSMAMCSQEVCDVCVASSVEEVKWMNAGDVREMDGKVREG